MTSTVHLVGAGPGDPDLLTLKAARLLAAAEIVLHDSLVDPRILALCTGAALIDVGKRCGGRSTAQPRINALLVEHAGTGQRIVRLKGGDPMIFGRADEELSALHDAGFAVEVVPGVTSAAAASALLQTSLTRREVSRAVHFITGHAADGELPPHDWAALARAGGTIVVYMGARKLAGLAAHLIEAGMDPAMPAVAVENAARPEARILRATIATLARDLAAAAPSGPVIILIGDALAKQEDLEALANAQKASKSLSLSATSI